MEVEKEDIEFYEEYYTQFVKAAHIATQVLLCECDEQMEHFKTRIKTKNSAVIKLKKLNIQPTKQNAVENLKDIVGIRIVCRFLADVYEVAKKIENNKIFNHILSKDYIKIPKENGYRSYHIILDIEIEGKKIPFEIQIRTIAQDCWASLEHKMKYKKEIPNETAIKAELKRIAGEMASSDMGMQKVRDTLTAKTKKEHKHNIYL